MNIPAGAIAVLTAAIPSSPLKPSKGLEYFIYLLNNIIRTHHTDEDIAIFINFDIEWIIYFRRSRWCICGITLVSYMPANGTQETARSIISTREIRNKGRCERRGKGWWKRWTWPVRFILC
jgi:hypothetical protein